MAGLAQEAKAALQALGVAPQKRRGQNFMVREEDLRAIAAAADPREGETVLEIGPGLGFLTRFLLGHGARVVVVEKDFVMARHLRAAYPGLEIFEKDVLKTRLADLGLGGPLKVAGNIPYNITSPILEWLIGQKSIVPAAFFTVQKEVAARLTARPGGKEWGSLSVFVQFHAQVSVLRQIPRSSFFPAPKVDSALIKLLFSAGPRVAVRDESRFFLLVRRAFQKRRKTLINALRSDEGPAFLAKEPLSGALEACRIDPRRRPETLTLEEWAALSDRL